MIRIVFFGTPQFAVPTLEALLRCSSVTVSAVITQPDKPAGRGGAITPPPVKVVAQREGIPVFQPGSLKREFTELRPKLDALGAADLGVVIAFGQILPTEVLDWPKHGCVNIHASLLPRWRGAAPIHRAIEAGDAETGVCVMQMDAGLDTGAVFSRSRTPIHSSDTIGTLHDRLAGMGAELLVLDLQSIVSGSLTATPQPQEGVTYARKITPDETKINWSLSSREIALRIRAFAPSPGCFSTFQGRRLKILQAHEVAPPAGVLDVTPGLTIQSSSESVVIGCGTGCLALEEVQLEGKKRMLISEFLRGSSIPVGSRLV